MLGVAKLLLVEIGAAQHRAHRQAVRDGEFRHQAHACDVALEAPLRHGGSRRRPVLDYRFFVRTCNFASSHRAPESAHPENQMSARAHMNSPGTFDRAATTVAIVGSGFGGLARKSTRLNSRH